MAHPAEVAATLPLAPESKSQALPDWWSLQPLARPALPTVEDDWVRTPIDRFVLAKLRQHSLTPTPATDRRTLIRRASFDLTGLPPSPEQVAAFRKDSSATAYEHLVDRLLLSPLYGERWGRHWLDVARFGESEGTNSAEDKLRGNAHKYRSAVIKALNSDLPYNQFVAFQLAGNTSLDGVAQWRDLAQFVELGTRLQDNAHPNDKKFHILDDMVSATGSAFLAMTVGCARCHDHKLDPITTEEYYRLTAVFFPLAQVSERVGVNSVSLIREPYLLAGGSWKRRVKRVNPGFLRALVRSSHGVEKWLQESSRPEDAQRALAAWMTDVEEGAGALLARVIVNRVWQYHFGRGIVDTANDFGRLGGRPTHPELLEWLACELIRHQWRLKPLHRIIMRSATYKQATDARWVGVDRDNKWLWHYQTRRLEAEAIRDSMLAASGSLRREMYGRSINIGSHKRPYIERPTDWRRSIYLMSPRFETHPVLCVFDVPTNFRSQARRTISTTPASALFMLNAPFVWGQAELLADRIKREAGMDPQTQVTHLYEVVLARPPTKSELELGLAFLADSRQELNGSDRALVQYCHTLLGLNEFIYVD